MKHLIYLMIPIFLLSCDPKDIERAMGTLNSLSNSDISRGLKEALNLGVGESVDFLSAPKGYYNSAYKILLPEEAYTVIDKLKFIPGFTSLEDELIKKINSGAEKAATKAGPIFWDAIKKISFNDAMNILMGTDNAATNFLHQGTYNGLYGEFNPIILSTLDEVGVQKLWGDAVKQYNQIPLLEDVNPDLANHVTNKALDGLFSLVAVKEKGIRTDISQRTSDLLRRVFEKQDGN